MDEDARQEAAGKAQGMVERWRGGVKRMPSPTVAETAKQSGKGKGPKRTREERDGTQQASQAPFTESSGDKQGPEDRPAKRAKANPPTDAPSDVEACPHCIKQGRPCINKPGRACEQCRKSKVKCPLFNGQRGKTAGSLKPRAPTEAPTSVKRAKSRAATAGPTAGSSKAATAGTSRASTAGPPSEFDADKVGNTEFGFPKAMSPAPPPPTSAQPVAPAPKAPRISGRRTKGMSTIHTITTLLTTPTKAPPL
jgi:hypothetical protein